MKYSVKKVMLNSISFQDYIKSWRMQKIPEAERHKITIIPSITCDYVLELTTFCTYITLCLHNKNIFKWKEQTKLSFEIS